MTAIDGLPPLREVIAAHGLTAKKALGQNFILDLNLTARIARAAGDLTASDVLEVGPGPGGLTRGLLAAGARRVLAIEKDPRCLPALAEIAAAYPGRLELIQGDALAVDAFAGLTPPIRIVANLPYNVGTELLVRWLTPPVWPPVMGKPDPDVPARGGGTDRGQTGRRGLRAARDPGAVADRCADRHVPSAGSLHARRPRCIRAVVQLTALPAPRYPADAGTLSRVVAAAFNQRRKMLRSALKGIAPDIETHLRAAGIDPTQRAEEVSLEAFCALARSLHAV